MTCSCAFPRAPGTDDMLYPALPALRTGFFSRLIASCMHFPARLVPVACIFPRAWYQLHAFSRALGTSCMHYPTRLVPVACIFSCFLLPRKVSRSQRSMADPRLSIKSRLENPPLLQYSDKNLYRRKKCKKKNIKVKRR